jgi:predicted oxidoreductase
MSKLPEKERDKLPESAFAFPKERKEPLMDATHVREAIARFDQVEGVTNKERDEAWKRIQSAAKKFDVELDEKDWRELFKRNGRTIPKE